MVNGESTSSVLDGLELCMAEAAAADFAFARCISNSGMFELANVSFSIEDAISFPHPDGAVAFYSLPELNVYGSCHLRCTYPSARASTSCCEAAQIVQLCTEQATISARCKMFITDSFAMHQRCTFAPENVALIAASSVLVIVFFIMTLFGQYYARCERAKVDLEARLRAASPSAWDAFWTSWNQTMNLVWKNMIVRRRRPLQLFIEVFLPVVLVLALIFITNLDRIFDWGNLPRQDKLSLEAEVPGTTIMCLGLERVPEIDLGKPSETMTTFYSSGQTVLGFFMLISYIKFVSANTTTMVIDKETRIREVMKIMGLSDFTLLASWCVTGVLLSLPLAFAVAAELRYGNIFPTTEFATLVFLFAALSLSIIAFSSFLTPFFNKSRTAALASVLLWLLLYFPFFSVQPLPNSTKYWAALSPPTAFGLAMDYLLRQAQMGSSFAYSIAVAQHPVTVPSVFEMTCFLILDSFLLFFLGWYFEQVLPQQYGVARPWYFVFGFELWVPVRVRTLVAQKVSTVQSTVMVLINRYVFAAGRAVVVAAQGKELELSQSDDSPTTGIEPVGASLSTQEEAQTCLRITGLRKVFTGDENKGKVAVRHLDLTMYSGQITALLGHNGAGKTTTISMLTALITPTTGDATLYGRSIKTQMHELRKIMGICPQHDVLFNELTVEEHLRFFGTMKCVPQRVLRDAVDKVILDVGLTEKRHVMAKQLSGGQKRKLSVALAFIGDSRLVFLDEPTSGMDPYSRRFTWNLLQRNRDGRVIVLTTHFMDEADILGDRIAIMSDGVLCCAGSSLFLKNRYGAGYNLTMIKAKTCDVDALETFLKRFVPDTKRLSNYGSEIVFQLPTASSNVFADMLEQLDAALMDLQVQEYGLSVTTLEEVFLRIASSRDKPVNPASQVKGPSEVSVQLRPPTAVTTAEPPRATPTFWMQYYALLQKRFRITKRDQRSLINAVCIPMLFLVILRSLPQVDVANFLPNYAPTLVPDVLLNNCTLPTYDPTLYDDDAKDYCLTERFSYCRLGILDCDAETCCNNKLQQSPFFRCNSCTPKRNPPCYNSKCLARDGAKLQVTMNAFLVSMVVMLAFAFIPASIVAFIVREKNPNQNAKELQLICGANISAYWWSSWTHDMLVAIAPVLTAMAVIPDSMRGASSMEEIYGVIMLTLSHAFAMVPLAYLFSFRHTKHAVAQAAALVFGLTTGGLLGIFSFLCRIIDFELMPRSLTSSLKLSVLDRNYLRWIFLVFPGYSYSNGLYEIGTRKLSRAALFGSGGDTTPASFFGLFEGLGTDVNCTSCWDAPLAFDCCHRGVFDLDVAGAPVIYAVLEAIIFTGLVFLIETSHLPAWLSCVFVTAATPESDEDTDVVHERERVESAASGSITEVDNIFIRHLRQQYGRFGKTALHDLSLAIPKGECFGYLGINGAGKSTTMKILTGQLRPTRGFVSVAGYNVAKYPQKARTCIGYCPQFDALHDLLTVEEQLEFYARLKGVPNDLVANIVTQKICDVGLHEYRHKLTAGLSGGNKRKVSTAIALIGAPQVVLLDEPSTGVDPSSRRKMWDVIAGVCARRESCVVLTTHSMEECEALCTRVGILISGKLKCLGSVQHLKEKYGQGYTVEVKLRDPTAEEVEVIKKQVLVQLGAEEAINKDNLTKISVALGAERLAKRIIDGEGGGWMLGNVLSASGSLSLDVFSSWWVAELLSEALEAFFESHFDGSILLERQEGHFRFQVPKEDMRPHKIFRLLEEAKPRLQVCEYGLSEASLEHIFNSMATRQVEERGEIRGLRKVPQRTVT